ncbi:hypothetical protein [Borrelia miyamotoi]|uniref:Uncharacterized protein n=1 Tax=Borrelia miyamotoi TaxID=47466 RepID=A0AAQ2WW36_9SPIR|nr:hypothetical protein [Borrelia miyamotoi]AGT27264.1 hypothetical protein I871_01430 [Borrelia miyamotoi LB-2001]AJA58448.1 hypothetical protein RJ61_01310 [Borrelia miyamotoi]AOW95526.1 hypothetical protein AXH25_01320 [Borrelia miyamotoi]QTL83410.1 hypothetical protein bmLB2001_000261 [Borrelia miyamotoi]WAZ85294.1 hypothetical protein O5400_02955 [Borrelia miyamotoi]
MLFSKLSKYVLLFSIFAFILSVFLGILARVTFIIILFRAFFIFIIFFFIGLLLEFLYKKYLYNLFQDDSLQDDSLNDDDKKDVNEDSSYKPAESDVMRAFSEDVPLMNHEKSHNDNSNFVKELSSYYNIATQANKLNDELSKQGSYIEKTDPKIVAETIKILINNKEE